MADTSRQSITLTNPQRKVLEEEAARLGISMPELIRRIIDEWRQSK